MSSEILLLLFFFVVLRQLFQYVRQRGAAEPEAGPGGTAGEPAKVGPLSEAGRPPQRDLEGLEPRHDAVSRERSAPPPNPTRLALPESVRRQGLRLHTAVEGLRGRAALGRGIVLMTLLGSCRANDPYE